MLELITFIVYFCALLGIALLSYQKQNTDTDFILGNRSLNFWLTALSAHSSDMSSWLFLGYPAMIFTKGVFGGWAAIGLTVFMFLNWQLVAPKLRIATEQTNSLTLNSYLENRFGDKSGAIRYVSAAMSILFFTFYISSGIVAMGLLVESLFQMSYHFGTTIGLFIVVVYVFMGGYRTIAWIDLFQGFFLLAVILFIPIHLLINFGGFSPVIDAVRSQNLSTSLLPSYSPRTIVEIFLDAAGWGLGYFGLPHVLTKFMGIRNVSDMAKAKWLGISWQTTALGAATLLGLIGIYLFPQGVADNEQIILDIVKATLPTFVAGLVLCAILAATTNVMAAQILVVASNLSEDYYKRIFRRDASKTELLWASRVSVLIISFVGYAIAFFKISTIYNLVFYSWSGLGASFGPIILMSLYRKTINRYGAFAGILAGGLCAAIWPYFNTKYSLGIPALVAGFVLSTVTIELVSLLTRSRSRNAVTE